MEKFARIIASYLGKYSCKLCYRRECNLAMQCGHTICSTCFHEGVCSMEQVRCPWCRENVTYIQSLFFVE